MPTVQASFPIIGIIKFNNNYDEIEDILECLTEKQIEEIDEVYSQLTMDFVIKSIGSYEKYFNKLDIADFESPFVVGSNLFSDMEITFDESEPLMLAENISVDFSIGDEKITYDKPKIVFNSDEYLSILKELPYIGRYINLAELDLGELITSRSLLDDIYEKYDDELWGDAVDDAIDATRGL